MQRNTHFVCGFNGFNQFTDLVKEKCNPRQSVLLSNLQTGSSPSRGDDENDGRLFYVHPVELHWQACLFYSWSSVYTSDSDQGDKKQFGFTQDRKTSFDGCQLVSSEQEDIQHLPVQLEYPDCPRGFVSHSIAQLKWNLNVDCFYLVSDRGVFEAREVSRREGEDSRGQKFTLSRFTVPTNTSVKSLSCGKEHVLLLTSDGNVFSFGSGSRGQLGMGYLEGKTSPTVIEALQPLCITMVAAGGWHSLALSNTGDVYSWGWNQSGQLGIGCFPEDDPLKEQKSCGNDEQCKRSMFSVHPILIDFREEVEKISCGARHSAAIFVDRTLWTWGWNGYGQLGLGDKRERHCPEIVRSLSTGPFAVTDVVCNAWNTLICTSARN